MQCKYQNRPGKFHECYHPLTLSGYSCILDEGKECSLYEEDLEDLVRIRPSDRVKLQNILDFCELEGRGPLIGLDVLRRIIGEPLDSPKIEHEHDWCNMAPNNHMTCSKCGKVYDHRR